MIAAFVRPLYFNNALPELLPIRTFPAIVTLEYGDHILAWRIKNFPKCFDRRLHCLPRKGARLNAGSVMRRGSPMDRRTNASYIVWGLRARVQTATGANRELRRQTRDRLRSSNENGTVCYHFATQLGVGGRQAPTRGGRPRQKTQRKQYGLGRAITERDGRNRISSAVHSTTLPPLRGSRFKWNAPYLAAVPDRNKAAAAGGPKARGRSCGRANRGLRRAARWRRRSGPTGRRIPSRVWPRRSRYGKTGC